MSGWTVRDAGGRVLAEAVTRRAAFGCGWQQRLELAEGWRGVRVVSPEGIAYAPTSTGWVRQ